MKRIIIVALVAILAVAGVYETQFVDKHAYHQKVFDNLSTDIVFMRLASRSMVGSPADIRSYVIYFDASIDDFSSSYPSLSYVAFHYRMMSAFRSCRDDFSRLLDYQTPERYRSTVDACADSLLAVKAMQR